MANDQETLGDASPFHVGHQVIRPACMATAPTTATTISLITPKTYVGGAFFILSSLWDAYRNPPFEK